MLALPDTRYLLQPIADAVQFPASQTDAVNAGQRAMRAAADVSIDVARQRRIEAVRAALAI